ncbi:MAG: UDP-N-acetylmuramoylalanyl-D-glutamyl-2, 6-diaminopimelate--D-alanyl-D-alanine ligase, partial [Ideonella sp.]
HLWCAGEMASHIAAAYGPAARHFGTVAQLLSQIGQAPAFSSVLVKGSRFMKMEQVVAALQATTPQAASQDNAGGAPHAA